MPASGWGFGSAGSVALHPPVGEQYRHDEKTLLQVMELAQSWPHDADVRSLGSSDVIAGARVGAGSEHATRASRSAPRIMG
jgi:hypothetical protein